MMGLENIWAKSSYSKNREFWMLNTMELCHSADNINFTQVEEVLWATFLGNSEQWFPFLAVSNLSVNCWPTGYQHITDSQ